MPPTNEEFLNIEDILQTATVYSANGKAMKLIDGLNCELIELLPKIFTTSKGGKITLELNIKPLSKNEMDIQAVLNSKQPRQVATGMMAYFDRSGRGYKEDPNQTRLPLEIAGKDKAAQNDV